MQWQRHSRPHFFFGLLAVIAFSLSAYFIVWSVTEADIDRRLSSELTRIETVISARINSYAGALYGIRAFIKSEGPPDDESFRYFIEQAEITERFPGLRGIGYSEAYVDSQRKGILRRIRGTYSEAELHLSSSGPVFSAVMLYEPLDAVSRKFLGRDVLAIPERARLVRSALQLRRPVISGLLESIADKNAAPFFQIFLPITVGADTLRPGDQWLHASFKVQEFFQAAFGAPSLVTEKVNWRVEEGGRVMYDRFQASATQVDARHTLSRTLNLMGREFRITVTPMFHFLTFADRYLAIVTGVLAGLLAAFVSFALYRSRRKLANETETKESLLANQNLITLQARNLQLLNRFSRAVAEELNEESLLAHFLSVIREAEIEFAYLYVSSAPANSHLLLHSWVGIEDVSVIPDKVSRHLMRQVMSNRFMLTKEHQIMGPSLARLLGPFNKSEDWIVCVIPTRQRTDQLMLVVGNVNSPFSKLQKELLDNVISHVGLGIDKIALIDGAQTSNRSKSAFLANMSHEIRTPLNALMGFSEMLAGRQLSDVRRMSIANSIRKNSEYLTRLVDDVLDLSKIEAGKLKIHPRRISLASLVCEIKSIIDLKANEKSLNFEVVSNGPLPSHVFVDDIRLKQILLNICGNAVKFTTSGSVSMAVSCRKSSENSGELVFYVEDTGPGISEEAQAHLFKPFSQGDETTTRKFGGSGLGLALSVRLANELGGSLRLIRSIKEVGSVFEILIPTGDLQGVEWVDSLTVPVPVTYPHVVAPLSVPRLEGIKVLLVEDSADNQEIFSFFLKNAGVDVDVVDNGLAAVEAAGQRQYDVVLMDIQIPGIDGKEATRRLRASGCMTTIVALTAHAMREEKESCIQAGCDGQITKPIGEKEFIEAVTSYLAQEPLRVQGVSPIVPH